MDYEQLLQTYNSNYNQLISISFRITKDYQLSEDICQNILLRIFERKDTLEIENYGGYLRATIRNRSLNAIRDRKRKREVHYEDNQNYEVSDE